VKRIRTLGIAAVMAMALTCSLGAGSASASTPVNAFQAGAYPVSATGNGSGTAQFAGWTMSCAEAPAQAELSAASQSLDAGLEGPITCSSGTIDWNGCDFILHPGAETEAGRFGGSFDIGPAGCGPIVVKYPWAQNCTATIPAQNGLAASYENIANGDVKVSTTATNIEHTRSAGPCGSAQTFKNGSFQGSWNLAGSGGVALHVGRISVPISAGGEFSASSYPVWIDGGSVAEPGPIWNLAKVNANCTDAQFTSEMTGPSAELAVQASYSGCKFGTLPMRVLMNDCYYVLTSAGSQNIACSKGGAIQLLVYGSKKAEQEGKVLCEAQVGAQAGTGSVKYSGSGSIVAATTLTNLQYTFKRYSLISCPPYEGSFTNGTFTDTAELNGWVAQ